MTAPVPNWTFPCKRIENPRLDGDTVDLMIDNGFEGFRKLRVRLLGIDAPERYAAGGSDALNYLRALLPAGQDAIVQTFLDRDKYGRWLGHVWFDDYDVASMMVHGGHAVLRSYSIIGNKATMK